MNCLNLAGIDDASVWASVVLPIETQRPELLETKHTASVAFSWKLFVLEQTGGTLCL